ncbi:hypothetical protein [Aeromicrobium sp. Leaf291]|uniref:hypothetical protein n=1 Tax=Aeromicrobium sp. Leaf291 TaxID=1736325 RepID=UPI0006F46F16|nr:hypothetical protein [Aeromicrobium sp. Leaf291]KQP81594.1 hypothetical protein ASF35_16315 [Aeromicrobium sp. Leaf291]
MKGRVRRLLPAGLELAHLRAWVLGIRDGWAQPLALHVSWNVDHLVPRRGDAQESLDAGINLGQRLRAPRRHERLEAPSLPDASRPFPFTRPAGSDADMFIQWKGTQVCLDFRCPCGADGHLDATFAYFVLCPVCGQEYELGTQVIARKVEGVDDGRAQILVVDELGGRS